MYYVIHLSTRMHQHVAIQISIDGLNYHVRGIFWNIISVKKIVHNTSVLKHLLIAQQIYFKRAYF